MRSAYEVSAKSAESSGNFEKFLNIPITLGEEYQMGKKIKYKRGERKGDGKLYSFLRFSLILGFNELRWLDLLEMGIV